MKIVILGYNGRMGNAIKEFYQDKHQIIGVDLYGDSLYRHIKDIPDKIDVVIDFSSTSAYLEIIYALMNNIVVISGTTGYMKETIDKLLSEYNKYFYWSNNYSKGINVMEKCFSLIKNEFDNVDLLEVHSKSKKDMPSGTAISLAHDLEKDLSTIQSLRLDNTNASHVAIFSSKYERITLIHETLGLKAYVLGVDKKLKELFYDKEIIRGRML